VSVLAAAQHCDGGGDHDGGEPDHQDGAGDEVRQPTSGVRAGHARHAEQYRGAPPHPPGPGVGDNADDTGDSDHKQ